MASLFSRILVPTDLSEASNTAIPLAVSFASLTGASLDLITVIDSGAYSYAGYPYANLLPELLAAADKRLQKVKLGAAGKKVNVTRQVIQGNVAEAITDYARKYAVDLIVMNTHARGRVAKFFLGSAANRVVSLAPCPVMLVREHDGVAPKSAKFKRILLPTDFSDRAAKGLKRAAQVAEESNAELVMLHVVDEAKLVLLPMTMQKQVMKELLERSAAQLKATAEAMGLRKPVRHVVLSGDPAKRISDFAQKEACDLVVMPGHGRGDLGQSVLGSVTGNVIRLVGCPVLVERGK